MQYETLFKGQVKKKYWPFFGMGALSDV